ncbi:glycosyltransferase family 2 protein [Halorientalis brevis]|uniref:Glycosyltransferase family 2 protein n=1 Tax=Halorientalis brevis TaxID=1126241 RepID=A0ABD6CG43_9EURY|nr:glycosyltransferase family 2 protein [Halorientalis brevis]
MYRNHSVGVVIPAYNEEGFVGDVIETVPAYVDRVYVIDDGSTDGTWDEIQTASDRVNGDEQTGASRRPDFDRRVVPIKHERNRGVGGAIKTGYQHAQNDRINVTAVMGGDGQMRPSALSNFLDPIVEGRADYTKGNRLIETETRAGMPQFRKVGNYILSGLTKIASGYWGIGDPQNGYTAISLEALDTIEFDEMYEFYGYCNDILVKLNVHDLQVEDVPRKCNYADEESHIDYKTYIPRVSGMLLRNFVWRLREQYLRGSFHPAALCYTIGMTTGVVGTILASVEAVTNGSRSRGVGNAIKTSVVGGIVFVLGTLFERKRHESLATASDPESELAQETETEHPVVREATDSAQPAEPTENGAEMPVTQDGQSERS